jgi:serine protease Do
MRAVTATGVAVGVLGLAAAVTLGAQTQTPAQPATKKESAVVIERQAGGPRLGIGIRDVGKEDVAALKLAGQAGVVIDVVEAASAAEKAGLKAKDVVVSFDGETVRSAQQLTRLVRETAPERAVKIAVMRDGKRMEIEATPTAAADERVNLFVDRDQIRGEGPLRFRMPRPPEGGAFEWFSPEGGPLAMLLAPGRSRLGVTVQDLTPELASYFGVKDGVLVASVTADSPAAKAGIKAGDVITTVNDKPVTTPGELVGHLGDKSGEVTIGLTRDKKPLTLKATIEAPKAPGRRVVLRGVPA